MSEHSFNSRKARDNFCFKRLVNFPFITLFCLVSALITRALWPIEESLFYCFSWTCSYYPLYHNYPHLFSLKLQCFPWRTLEALDSGVLEGKWFSRNSRDKVEQRITYLFIHFVMRGIFKQSVEQFKMTFFIEKYGRL